MFVTRLAPVLYSPLWLAVLFLPASVAAIVWQYSARSGAQQLDGPLPREAVTVVVVAPSTEQQEQQQGGPPQAPPSEDTVQLQELFRMAKQGRTLDVIRE